jgi:hypothetical protein
MFFGVWLVQKINKYCFSYNLKRCMEEREDEEELRRKRVRIEGL